MYSDMTMALAQQRRSTYQAQAAEARLAATVTRRPRLAKQVTRLRRSIPLFRPLYEMTAIRPAI